MLYAYTKTGIYMYNKQDIIEKIKKDHMYIVHGHKARVRGREGEHERKREGGVRERGRGRERV